VLGQRVQHVVQEPNAGADGNLLCRGELCRMAGILGGDNALLGGFGPAGPRRGGQGAGRPAGGQRAAVEGERDLDFSLVGYAGDHRCACGERHCEMV
jgi:hypothetical protein